MIPSWLERESMMLGAEGVEKLRRSTVLVAGLGGVGSFAAEAVARAGVGRLVLIDNDKVCETNLNRQLPDLHSTIGRLKTDVMASRRRDSNPEMEVSTRNEYIDYDNVAAVVGHGIDFVIDAIDTLGPKIALILHCLNSGIPLVSSMGAGAKWDVTKVRIADVSKSFNCPLAAMLRKRLRYKGVKRGFPVVFSEELPYESAVVEVEGETNKRSRVGTISYLTPVFGCACAQVCIRHIVFL